MRAIVATITQLLSHLWCGSLANRYCGLANNGRAPMAELDWSGQWASWPALDWVGLANTPGNDSHLFAWGIPGVSVAAYIGHRHGAI